MDELWINQFNLWLAERTKSNMNAQIILEGYSCAAYVVEYVNKTNRGISNLHQELITLQNDFPEENYNNLLESLSMRMLNTVEMCTQEAAWYLLRLSMSECSRKVEYIPTVWPRERQKVRKTKEQMKREKLEDESTDIWKKNTI